MPPDAVREQLKRIIACSSFQRSRRLTSFLQYVVEQSLKARQGDIKEQVIALEVYGRGSDFDPSTDPIIRIDARRLRDKLREFYAESPAEPVVITLPKGGYVPSFAWRTVERVPKAYPRLVWITVGLILVLGAVLFSPFRARVEELKLRPLAPLPGLKGPPSLSPDGRLFAFTWSGPMDRPSRGIYIQKVDGGEPRQLTLGGAGPVWSPDATQIAFFRSGENSGLFVISPEGGTERKVTSRFPNSSGANVVWTPDGQNLVFAEADTPHGRGSIQCVSLATSEVRSLTKSPGGIGDNYAAVSPDGKTLAFVRYGIPFIGDIYLVPMEGGEPRRLTNWNRLIDGLAWMPDGREIVYSAAEPIGHRLWRIPVNAAAPGRGKRLPAPIGDAQRPSISNGGKGAPQRLAFLANRLEEGLHLASLTANSLGAPQPLLRSSRSDHEGNFSPDATQVAFVSNRDGADEIWVGGVDGSNPRRLTHLSGVENAFPVWSPDGRTIAFISPCGAPGMKCLFLIDAAGGQPQRLTEPSIIGPPAWSPDGGWIYFMSDWSGSNQIWKVARSGGLPTRITRNGGFEVQASPDGKYLYYTDPAPPATLLETQEKLKRVPVEGGTETVVLQKIWSFHWSVTKDGIYYISGPSNLALNLYRFSVGDISQVADLGGEPPPHAIKVSQDGRLMLSHRYYRNDTDLILIDNFH